MPKIYLPGLCSGDPEAKLSDEARLRIQEAFLTGAQAHEAILADLLIAERFGTKEEPEIREEKYKAKVNYAHHVLKVEIGEFISSGAFTDRELPEIIRGRVEAACYSLCVEEHRQALEIEFMNRWRLAAPAKPPSIAPESTTEPLSQPFIERLTAHIKTGKLHKSKASFYRSLKIDKADYYAWERGEHSKAPSYKPRIEEAIKNLPI